jgi:hypothetical protein
MPNHIAIPADGANLSMRALSELTQCSLCFAMILIPWERRSFPVPITTGGANLLMRALSELTQCSLCRYDTDPLGEVKLPCPVEAQDHIKALLLQVPPI